MSKSIRVPTSSAQATLYLETLTTLYSGNTMRMVAHIARAISEASPAKQNQWARKAGVPWVYIHALRQLKLAEEALAVAKLSAAAQRGAAND